MFKKITLLALLIAGVGCLTSCKKCTTKKTKSVTAQKLDAAEVAGYTNKEVAKAIV